MKKVGIMGGTFNPIHHGHLFLAENAYDQIGLDQILFMPSKNPPHKINLGMASEEHRTNMVKFAIQDNPHFDLSTMELERDGITYTADTLNLLTTQNPETEYYFILGADSLMMIPNWKDPQTIFNLCTIVVAGRDKVNEERLYQQSEYLKASYGGRIIHLGMPMIQISSVIIRDRIAENKSVRYYVPDDILSYLTENHLYDVK